ncbi:MAG: ABC transporter ATP-binding protein [Eubacterium sp.]|nr:ABC transporter ATP-binding protein [Eubacterium sp.]
MEQEKSMPAIVFEDVVFRYIKDGKRNILDHVSLEIEKGKITVLMGASGCGKSTFAAVTAGLYPENGGYLERGDVLLFGKQVREMNPQTRAGYLTLMFQNPNLQFCMDTLRREMEFCLENMQVPAEDMDDRIEEAASQLDVKNLLDKPLQTLSGGEKQKANLACLFLIGAQCVLLDEPFANIDKEAAGEIVHMIYDFRKAGGTVVAIDHRLDLWLDVADEIRILGKGGSVIADGINKENLQVYIPVLQREGLFYPKSRKKAEMTEKTSQPAIIMKDFSVCRDNPKRSWLGRKSDPREIPGNLLLDLAKAEFPQGALSAVLGPSGSGKTTTFLSVLKEHPYYGTIEIMGCDLKKIAKKDLYHIVGIVFQNPANQFVTQNVKDEVIQSLSRWKPELSAEECLVRAEKLLKDYGLEAYQDYSPYMLSQGQQRRLAVLSVLAGGQRILLLDEPTYGQDYRSAMSIINQIRREILEENLTVIIITHDEQLAYTCADRIYRLSDKRFVEEETG